MLLFWKPNQAYSNGMEFFFCESRYDAHLERFDVIAAAVVAGDLFDFFPLKPTPTQQPQRERMLSCPPDVGKVHIIGHFLFHIIESSLYVDIFGDL